MLKEIAGSALRTLAQMRCFRIGTLLLRKWDILLTMGIWKNKDIFYNKEAVYWFEVACRMGEHPAKSMSCRRPVFRIYKEHIKVNMERTKPLELNEDFSKVQMQMANK